MHHDSQIKQIIKRCLRLTYVLALSTAVCQARSTAANEFEHILELCPSIRYIQCGFDPFDTISDVKQKWLALSRSKRGYTDIENKSDYEKREAYHLPHVEFWSTIEEKHLPTLKVCLQQPSSLEHLRLSGSYRIGLCSLWNRFTQQNSNILLHSSQLKSFDLRWFSIPHQTENNISFESLFYHFEHIERLNMTLRVRAVDNVDEERSSVYKMVEAVVHQLHQIQCLHIELSDRIKFDTKMVLDDKLFTPLCDGIQKLEILHLHNVPNVPISDNVLLHLANHSKLHTVSLSGYHLHNQLSKDPWISYARKCKEQEQSSNGRIRSILLGQCGYGVTDEVLEEFAGIKSLETLRIVCSSSITDAGVNKFGNIKNSSSKKHNKIELHDCKRVSLDNPNAVFLHPAF